MGNVCEGLRELGYVDGRNITIENLSSEGKYERLPALAAELVRHKVDVIVAPAAQNVIAAKQATQTIPIVMVSVGDPVGNGLVASLARPGGNVTGTSFLTSAIVGKQLELLTQITPHVSRLAILLNPANPGHPLTLNEAKGAAHSLGVQRDVPSSPHPDHTARGENPPARDVRAARVCRRWRLGMLRTVCPGELSTRRGLRGQDSQGREAR